MSNHRADTRAKRAVTSDPRPPGGRRRAERTSVLAHTPLSALPMIPTVTGAVAVAVAAGGTVSAGAGQAGHSTADDVVNTSGHRTDTRNDGTDGTDAIAGRTVALSRDSDRQARSDASGRRTQNALDSQATQRNAALTSLARSAEKQAGIIKANMWHLPTEGYHLTARFGSAGGLWSNNHTGLDFAAPTGTPIFAVANGTITQTGFDGSYGNKTVETLDDGTEIWYAHQSAIDVTVGEHVTGGETIGAIGSTGNTTGPHVHIEVRPGGGDPVDPYTAMVYHGLHP